jgi:hypothetical protein
MNALFLKPSKRRKPVPPGVLDALQPESTTESAGSAEDLIHAVVSGKDVAEAIDEVFRPVRRPSTGYRRSTSSVRRSSTRRTTQVKRPTAQNRQAKLRSIQAKAAQRKKRQKKIAQLRSRITSLRRGESMDDLATLVEKISYALDIRHPQNNQTTPVAIDVGTHTFFTRTAYNRVDDMDDEEKPDA